MIARPRRWIQVTPTAFDTAHKIVTASGAGQALDTAARAAAGKGGAPTRLPQYNGPALLTALLLLAMMAQPLTVANVVRLLWTQIDDSMRARVGLDHPAASALQQAIGHTGGRRREYERCRQALDRLLAPYDPSPHPRRVRETNATRAARLRALTPERKADLEGRRSRLLALCNSLIGASLPPRPAHHDGSLASDEVIVQANARTGGTGTRKALPHGADPDAGWWNHKQKNLLLWGYGLTLAVATHPLRGREVPNVIAGMSISVPTGGRTPNALEALDAAIANGWGPRPSRNNNTSQPTFVVDRGFSDKHGLAPGLVERGYGLSADYSRDSKKRLPPPVQHEFPQGPVQYGGAILCPAALALVRPQADPVTGEVHAHPGGQYDTRTGQLRIEHPGDPRQADPADLDSHRALQDLLQAHRMPANTRLTHRPRGAQVGRPRKDAPPPTPTHSLVVACPAAAGQLRCPLVARSVDLPRTVPRAHTPPTPDADGNVPAACASTYTTLHLDAPTLKRHQTEIHGTDDWADRHNGTRSRNEQVHSQLKDRNAGACDDDAFELTGTARVSLITALVIAAVNLRQTAAFEDTTNRNGGTPPYEDRRDLHHLRDQIIAAQRARGTGPDTAAA